MQRGMLLRAHDPISTVSVVSPPVSSTSSDLYVDRTERAPELRTAVEAGKFKIICRNQMNDPWKKWGRANFFRKGKENR